MRQKSIFSDAHRMDILIRGESRRRSYRNMPLPASHRLGKGHIGDTFQDKSRG